MKYHAAKMEEINEYIKELWTKIYRGNGKHELCLCDTVAVITYVRSYVDVL